MSKAANLTALEALHAKVAEVLSNGLDDDPSPQLIAQVLKFLKDNGVEPARDANNSALDALQKKVLELSKSDDPDELRAFIQ